jgi:hypothetical protein
MIGWDCDAAVRSADSEDEWVRVGLTREDSTDGRVAQQQGEEGADCRWHL